MARLERILDRTDELGMVVILGIFYFGQDERLADEAAVIRAVDNTVDWVLDHGYPNVLIEVNNECNVRYDHDILKPDRVHELIDRVKARTRDGRRLLVGTSYGGGTVPDENVVRASDFLLMHGNGVNDPARIAEMVRQARAVPGYRPMPILFNEDDHFDFDKPHKQLHRRHRPSTPPGATSTPASSAPTANACTTTSTATSPPPSTGPSTPRSKKASSDSWPKSPAPPPENAKTPRSMIMLLDVSINITL